MIRSLPIHITLPSNTQPAATTSKAAHPAGTSTTSAGDFRKLLNPAAAPVQTTVEVPHLGPFTGDPVSHPVATPKPPDPITSSPWLPASFPGDQNLMNRTEHESTMNAWLQNYTKWSNDNKTQIYQQAMVNWQLNNQRCQELGIAGPPQPKPPTLDPVESMPAGWWFKS